MKKTNILKILILTLTCVIICFTLFGCSRIKNEEPLIENDNPYTATFIVDGKIYTSESAGTGIVAKPIKDPVKANRKFVCWSTEKDKNIPYDFSTVIDGDITLYAYFEFDEEGLVNEVEKVSNSIVKVVTTFNENGEAKTREGVGIVYHIQNGYCYVLTTCHTILTFEHQTNAKITVYDKENNEYAAKVFKSRNKEHAAFDKEYDLSVVCFQYSGTVLKENESIDVIDYMGESVVSIGSSKDVFATGTVNEKKIPSDNLDKELSSVDFEVYCHTAIPTSDVKESLLYNLDMYFVGLTYYSDNGVAYTIPVTVISEFLDLYLYG